MNSDWPLVRAVRSIRGKARSSQRVTDRFQQLTWPIETARPCGRAWLRAMSATPRRICMQNPAALGKLLSKAARRGGTAAATSVFACCLDDAITTHAAAQARAVYVSFPDQCSLVVAPSRLGPRRAMCADHGRRPRQVRVTTCFVLCMAPGTRRSRGYRA
jgi:hypothetical protein